MVLHPRKIILLLPLIILCGACQRTSPEQKAVIAFIEQHRQGKDENFRHDPQSPLLPEDKAHFQGLKYYPVNLDMRFEGPITRYDSTRIDTILGTKGDKRAALRYGYFEFHYQGKPYRLQIYKMIRQNQVSSKYLFLGFTDETTGKETYGAGRYIDLTENDQNYYVIDFNLAYNPYCAYNPRYTCAIPPAENHLPFPVKAGEKIFKEH